MIKVTLKEGVTFEADDSTAAYYAFIGATIEKINLPETKKVGRKKIKK